MLPRCKKKTNSFLVSALNLGGEQPPTPSEIAEFSARGLGVESKQVPAVIRLAAPSFHPPLETRISDSKAVLAQSLHGASYFSGVQDEHASRSSYGATWGFLAKISTRKSINTVVLVARRRPPALSANMDLRLSYSGNRRRTAPDAISSPNSHAGPLG